MSLKKFVTALTAVSLAAAPTVGAAQAAAPVAPAEETVEGSQLRGDSGIGQVLPLFVILAIVLLSSRTATAPIRPSRPDRATGKRMAAPCGRYFFICFTVLPRPQEPRIMQRGNDLPFAGSDMR